MKIVFFEIDDLEADILRQLYGDVDYDVVKGPLNADNVTQYADVEIIAPFVYSDLSRDILSRLPDLKLIATRSRTSDHVDMAYCRERGIAVLNVPSYGEHAVAEHAFAMLLSLVRAIPQAVQKVKEGDFALTGLQGIELSGKTMGVIGLGAIGQHVAQMAKGFGMDVIAYDVQQQEELAKNIGFTYVDMESLLRQSDVISLHTAPVTQYLLSEREFSLMKNGVIIINTSFGAAIDVKALLQALSNGKVQAAGLDVLPDERGIKEEAELLRESFVWKHDAEVLLTSHALLRNKNVIVTPHSAFYTKETVTEILRKTGENIRTFLGG